MQKKYLKNNHLKNKNKLKNATEFYVLNRTSYSGNPLAVGMARWKFSDGTPDINPRFTNSSVERLNNFKIKKRFLSVKYLDFKKSIKKDKSDLMYLDPPYMIKSKIYDSKDKEGNLENFDHEGLAKILKKDKKKKWILSYNNTNSIKKLYGDYKILKPKWAYGMSNEKKSREILIFSTEVNKKLKKLGIL
jgi:DNA adenine methylase